MIKGLRERGWQACIAMVFGGCATMVPCCRRRGAIVLREPCSIVVNTPGRSPHVGVGDSNLPKPHDHIPARRTDTVDMCTLWCAPRCAPQRAREELQLCRVIRTAPGSALCMAKTRASRAHASGGGLLPTSLATQLPIPCPDSGGKPCGRSRDVCLSAVVLRSGCATWLERFAADPLPE
jgi:hypothetical protein